jgi:ABC-type glycerol-3-phosphate transport system substrate-binding protein
MKSIIFSILIFSLPLNCHRENKTVVTFWHVMSGPLGKKLDEMIADFNLLHPEGEVRSVQMGSYDALAQKLMAAVSSQTPPVIAQMYESWTDQFHAAGELVPLQDFIRSDTLFDLSDFYPVFIRDNTYDSVLVTLPFNKSVPVFYYNADLLKLAGSDDFPDDWTKFRRVCEAVKRRGVWPTSWPIDVWYYGTMLYQTGDRLYDEAGGKPGFNSPNGVAVLEYLVGLVRDKLFYLNPGFQRQDEFLAGNVAMIPASVVSWAFLKGRPAFNMLVAPFPQGTYKSVIIAGTNIGIFRKVSPEQRRLGWEFIRWFLRPENQARWTRASYYLPTRRSAAAHPGMKSFLAENPGYDRILEQLDFADTEPRTRVWFTGRYYLTDALEEALRDERSARAALDNAARRMIIENR